MHPEHLADDAIPAYGNLVRAGAASTHLEYLDLWWADGLRPRKRFFDFLGTTKMRGFTQWSDHQGVEYSPDGTPIIHSNCYYTLHDPVKFASEMSKEATEVDGPWFVVVYGGTPWQFSQVAQALPDSKFKIVSLDGMFEIARAVRGQVEGKIWKPPRHPPAAAPDAP